MKIIKISEWCDAPIARFRSDGEKSGQELREDILKPAILSLQDGEKLLVDFDGMIGCTSSFIDEAFGELARDIEPDTLISTLEIKATERPALTKKVKNYIMERRFLEEKQ